MTYVPIFFLLFLIISSFPPKKDSIIIDVFDNKSYIVLSSGMFVSKIKEIKVKKINGGNNLSYVPTSFTMNMPNIIITWCTVKHYLDI